MKPVVFAFIFARGGSKGLPGKNLRPLAGRPLISYAIETGLNSPWVDRVIVSTDSEEIAETARQWGAEVPFLRPAELAGDRAPEHLAWQHAVSQIAGRPEFPDMDIFVSLPATAPLRAVEDVDACIERFVRDECDVVIGVAESPHSPWFNMVVMNDDGTVQVVMRSDQPTVRRQDAPTVFNITTAAYVTRPDFIMASSSYFEGRVKAVKIPRARAVDIDTEDDFQYAEFLMEKRRRERE